MKLLKIFTLILIVIAFSSCKKDDEIEINENDYLIFGHFYGECNGESCVETYKLTNQKLYEDLNDNYTGIEPFNFTELSNDKYYEVKELLDIIPAELLSENETTFGCPDCADQGGLLIIYKKGESKKRWKIDQFKNEVPSYFHDFMDKVNEKINLINNSKCCLFKLHDR